MYKDEIFFLAEDTNKDTEVFSWYVKDIYTNSENKNIYVVSSVDDFVNDEELTSDIIITKNIEDYFGNRIATMKSFEKEYERLYRKKMKYDIKNIDSLDNYSPDKGDTFTVIIDKENDKKENYKFYVKDIVYIEDTKEKIYVMTHGVNGEKNYYVKNIKNFILSFGFGFYNTCEVKI